MTANRPGGRHSSGSVPPTSRRSARQQRLANREASRALARASTHGSSGPSGSLILYTAVAVLIGVVVIGIAFFLSSQPKSAVALGSPNPPLPSVLTPSSIPTNGRTLGNADAKVTIDVYEDFQCTGCFAFTRDIEPQVVANYVATGKAKLVYHDFLVIDGRLGGTESLDAANAALCANDQGKFWPYHDWVFANQYTEASGAFTKDRLKAIAHAMGGLDNAKFDSCVDGGSHNSEVQAEKPPAGANGTPTIVVNGTIVVDTSGQPTYDYATVSAALDKALGVSPSPSASASATPVPSPTATPVPSAVATPSASPSVKPS
jgi:protein-disulfide isomerase